MLTALKKNNSGAAMVLAVCVMAIITALCLSLLMYASVLLSGSQNVAPAEQCRVLAVTLSEELERQIIGPEQDGELWLWLRANVWTDSWPYFNDEERGHTERFAYKYFNVDPASLPTEASDALKNYTLEVVMYWESEIDADKDGTPLYAIVTCSNGKDSVTITNEFLLAYREADENLDEEWSWSLSWRE